MVLRIFLLSVSALSTFSSLAVTNQELMDRLDDMESAQQIREMNMLMDEYMKAMSQSSTKVQPRVEVKKAEGNYKKLSDGEVLRWMNDKVCYVSWGQDVKNVAAPIKNHKYKEITQQDTLIAIVYFPKSVTETTIKSLLDRDGFFKIKKLCAQ
jgi:hypothetical protein